MNIPENKILQLVRKIESTEKTMKSSPSNYLTLYSELKDMEKNFIDIVSKYEKNNIQLSDDVKKHVDKRKKIIEKNDMKAMLKNGKC